MVGSRRLSGEDSYFVLTGATGLLGCYLLRDLLQAGFPLAVLVRSSRLEPAVQRIETLMARWESQLGYALPRPVVLEGDVNAQHLGLGSEQLEWVAGHCRAVIHSAASLTFEANARSGEPWRSNVEGTANVLEFCRRTGIGRLHHVSTAYVCGLRRGRILESEADVGQTLGNEYERSKLEAERLVQAADFLAERTIYRPGIIVGDWRTGYTTTFHGFYTPLKLVHAMVNKVQSGGVQVGGILSALGLSGEERKNFVPVDWVSAVMAHILATPAQHGQTYHLTPGQQLSIRDMAESMERAIRMHSVRGEVRRGGAIEGGQFEQVFREQMRTYQAYWRDDPQFDCSNTQQAAPHLPCPVMDGAALMRMCRYAIENNFGWPKPPPVVPEFDARAHLSRYWSPGSGFARLPDRCLAVGLQVNGCGGGQWTVAVDGPRVLAAGWGLSPRCQSRWYMNTKTLERLIAKDLTVSQAIETGRVVVEGPLPAQELAAALEFLCAARPEWSSPSPQERFPKPSLLGTRPS